MGCRRTEPAPSSAARAAIRAPGQACSGYLLRCEGTTVWLDAGHRHPGQPAASRRSGGGRRRRADSRPPRPLERHRGLLRGLPVRRASAATCPCTPRQGLQGLLRTGGTTEPTLRWHDIADGRRRDVRADAAVVFPHRPPARDAGGARRRRRPVARLLCRLRAGLVTRGAGTGSAPRAVRGDVPARSRGECPAHECPSGRRHGPSGRSRTPAAHPPVAHHRPRRGPVRGGRRLRPAGPGRRPATRRTRYEAATAGSRTTCGP